MKRCFARAPVRVDPAGGGTDAPPFSVEHGGAVVNFAVNFHAYASAQRLPAGEGVIIHARDLHRGVAAASVEALADGEPLRYLKAFVRRLAEPGDGLMLTTESDVPAGSGLGGSGAMGVAIVAALDGAYGRQRTAAETADLANEIERKDLGFPGGSQDSFGAALGGINRLAYHVGGEMTPHRIEVSDDTRRRLEYNSLLMFTGAAHVSGSIHEDIKRSYAQPESPTVAAMFGLREAAERMAAALTGGDLEMYADQMAQSRRYLYQLHASCDSDELRRYFTTLDDVILGGKPCGAGGGGFILVYARDGRRGECLRRGRELGGQCYPVTIDFEGLRSWAAPPVGESELRAVRDFINGCQA